MHVFIHPRSLLYLPSVIFYFLQNGEQKIKKQKKINTMRENVLPENVFVLFFESFHRIG